MHHPKLDTSNIYVQILRSPGRVVGVVIHGSSPNAGLHLIRLSSWVLDQGQAKSRCGCSMIILMPRWKKMVPPSYVSHMLTAYGCVRKWGIKLGIIPLLIINLKGISRETNHWFGAFFPLTFQAKSILMRGFHCNLRLQSHMLHGARIFNNICPNKITQFCR